MDASGENMVVWNGSKAEVYRVTPTDVLRVSDFSTRANALAIASSNDRGVSSRLICLPLSFVLCPLSFSLS